MQLFTGFSIDCGDASSLSSLFTPCSSCRSRVLRPSAATPNTNRKLFSLQATKPIPRGSPGGSPLGSPLLTPHLPHSSPQPHQPLPAHQDGTVLHLIKYLEESRLSADLRRRQEDEERRRAEE
ncbi:hypothetical protein E2C01_072888 [Portunus trituberculatus]|uniref:Uncharacterized protein n=1 Tax=Portunus trituberculatus TaxID=210409 RepID=A0A5B7I7W4_PORTR|nr:hypothetical protein [Portunus trituberculatus]